MGSIHTNNQITSSSPITNTSVTVGTTSTLVLAEAAGRLLVTLTNDSNETIYISLNAAAVMNKGIRINANGGMYELNQNNLYKVAIYAICASGGKNLCITYAGQ